MAFRNLWRRKLRTLLTVIGVLMGTASIVTMLSLGIGMNENFKNQVSRMGSLTTINIDSYGSPEGGKGGTGGTETQVLDDRMIDTMAQWRDVEAATPLLDAGMKGVVGKYVAYLNITGIRPEALKAFDFQVQEGRLLTQEDTNALLFGSQVGMWFYNPKNMGMGPPPQINLMTAKLSITFDMSYGEKQPPGQGSQGGGQKTYKLIKATTAGIIPPMNNEKDYGVYMNINHLKKLVAENNKGQTRGVLPGQQQGYQRAMVKVKDFKFVKDVQKRIKDLGFNAFSLTDILDQLQKTAQSMQNVLGGIGAVSLLVAAIGISNTMVMSIYERTREIGIMKVLGADFSDIRKLFLLEAGMIGLLGGILGLAFSLMASAVLNSSGLSIFNTMGPIEPGSKISIIPVWLGGYSLIFSTLIGIISGFYPALRAMRLSALEAIKTE